MTPISRTLNAMAYKARSRKKNGPRDVKKDNRSTHQSTLPAYISNVNIAIFLCCCLYIHTRLDICNCTMFFNHAQYILYCVLCQRYWSINLIQTLCTIYNMSGRVVSAYTNSSRRRELYI